MLSKPAPPPARVLRIAAACRFEAITVDDEDLADRLFRAAAMIEGAYVKETTMQPNPHAFRIAVIRWAAAKFRADASQIESGAARFGPTKVDEYAGIVADHRLAAAELDHAAAELEADTLPMALESVSILDATPPPWTVLLDLRVRPSTVLLDKPPAVREQIVRVLKSAGDRLGELLTTGR